jgi:hypothetical protein
VNLPWALGLGATHSWRKSVAGLDDLETLTAQHIQDGIAASAVLDPSLANYSMLRRGHDIWGSLFELICSRQTVAFDVGG